MESGSRMGNNMSTLIFCYKCLYLFRQGLICGVGLVYIVDMYIYIISYVIDIYIIVSLGRVTVLNIATEHHHC